MRFLLLLLAAASVAAAAPAAKPTALREWDFSKGVQGWKGNNTTPLRTERGALVFEPTAADVGIVSPPFEIEPQFGDVLEIRLKSTAAGTAEWFWRTTTEGPYAGFNAQMRRSVGLAAGDQWQVLRCWPFWHGEKRIINVRFDPPEGQPGRYAVASVRIIRLDTVGAGPARFDFTAGLQGWSVSGGTAKAGKAGLRVRLEGPAARMQSPPLAANAAESAYVILDVTTPPHPDGDIPAVLQYVTENASEMHPRPFRLAPSRRATYSIRMDSWPGWHGRVLAVMLGTGVQAPVDLVLHSLRVSAEPAAPDLSAPATGLEVQTEMWRTEARVPAAVPRIDVAKQAPPETRPVGSDFTVAMWYFAAWEPEYTWDGWKQVAERSPWRLPLLYDSADPAMEYNGIRFYRASNSRVVDWHVHWMREHAVNLMLWDWYSRVTDKGDLDPGFFANRALETGFLGKRQVGDPPVPANRFEGKMDFAVMWTNHGPHDHISRDLWQYVVEQFFSQPNYYRVDGKPLLVIWSLPALVQKAGGVERAKAEIAKLRRVAQEHGLAGVYVAVVHGADAKQMGEIGIDGVTGYHYAGSGGYRLEGRRVGDRVVRDQLEDYPAQTVPGHVARWRGLAGTFGREYLLATTPMQNWEPTFRAGNHVMQRQTPDAFREMLRRAKALIGERGLRPFVNIEAWNEWLEGSYVEPSTQWGLAYLEAIRDTFGSGLGAGERSARGE